MEIIKKEDAVDLLFHSKGNESPMTKWIKKLEVGEVLKIDKSDWNRKQPPYYLANYLEKKSNRTFQCGKLPGFDGWVIKRLS